MRCVRSVISERGSRVRSVLFRWAVVPVFFALGACFEEPVVQQPFEFSHKRHFEAEIDCLTCHEKAADEPHATLPLLKGCMKCHKEKQGDTPEEGVLLQYAARKEEPPWVQVNHVAGHVYFSHRAHVGFAEMECDVCHGDMKKVEHVLTRSNTEHLTMRACIACHAKQGASNDCVVCHQ